MDQDSSEVRTIRYLRNITVNVDGRAHLFDGGVAQTVHPQRGPVDDDDGYFLIYESHIASVFAGFLSLISALYRAGSYLGSVDVGLKLTGLEGARSVVGLDQRFAFAMVADRQPFSDSTYPRTERIAAAAELDQPEDIARRFLRHLFEATTHREDFDPFAA
jgi:hypothetical protein